MRWASSIALATCAFGKRKESGFVRHPDVAGGGQLHAAAHTGAVDGGHDRAQSLFHHVEDAVPLARVVQTFHAGAATDLAEVQAGAEMVALAGDHDRAAALRQGQEGLLQFEDHAVGDGIALGGPLDADVRDRAVVGDGDFRHANRLST